MFSKKDNRFVVSDAKFTRLYENLVSHGPWASSANEMEWVEVCNAFCKALQTNDSIDSFIFAHMSDDKFVKLAKLAIAYQIAKGEFDHDFIPRNREISESDELPSVVKEFEPGWLRSIWSILVDGIDRDNVDGIFDNLSVVSFNYDRVFQIGLFRFLVWSQLCVPQRARDLVNRIEIVFPYGCIAPWDQKIAYNVLENIMLLDDFSNNIKTFGESRDEEVVQNVHGLLQAAETIVFLGFSFHKQNNVFIPDMPRSPGKNVFFTSRGLSYPSRHDIKDRLISKFFNGNQVLHHSPNVSGPLVDFHGSALELLAEFRSRLVL